MPKSRARELHPEGEEAGGEEEAQCRPEDYPEDHRPGLADYQAEYYQDC